MPDCLVCRELSGEIHIPGSFILSDPLAVGFHVPPLEANSKPYLGHLLVVTRRHIASLADLTEAESATVGRMASHLASMLRERAGAEWVYSAIIGTGVPHFHQHLLPRYPGTPSEVRWYAVDEWEGGRHGGAPEISEFIAKLRS